MKCPGCHTEMRDDSRFCSKCGTPIELSEKGPPAPAENPRAPAPALIPGTVLAGKYKILEEIGRGGMGVVYRARDTHLDRFVAIKVLAAEKTSDSGRRQRFTQEARSASSLQHPNIITVHDIAGEAGMDFIVMEYVTGKTLGDLIPRRGMPLGAALKCAVQIADALAAAHLAGIVHRDLKPGNVMVTEEGRVKILDFGLAKLTENIGGVEDMATRTMKPATEEGTILGTTAYMSPEQAEGKKVDTRSDIFSFGAVLYEMITGQRAFQADTQVSTLAAILNAEPKPFDADTPNDLQKLIHRCLRKEPARRFQHMADVKVALEELRDESESGSFLGPGARGDKKETPMGASRGRFSWDRRLGGHRLMALPSRAESFRLSGGAEGDASYELARCGRLPFPFPRRRFRCLCLEKSRGEQLRYLHPADRRRPSCPEDDGSGRRNRAVLLPRRPTDRVHPLANCLSGDPRDAGAWGGRTKGLFRVVYLVAVSFLDPGRKILDHAAVR